MCMLSKTDKYVIWFDEISLTLRVIDTDKPEPVLKEVIDGSTTISEFASYIERIKEQLGIKKVPIKSGL